MTILRLYRGAQRLRNARTHLDGCLSPNPEIAVIESVTLDDHVTHAGLLEPETGIAFHQNGRTRDMKEIVFDHDFSARAQQQTACAVAAKRGVADGYVRVFNGCHNGPGVRSEK